MALVNLANETGVDLADPDEFHEEPGRGVRAQVDNQAVFSGRAAWLRDNGIDDPLMARDDGAETEGHSVIFVARGGQYLGWIGLQDQARPEARVSLQELRALGVKRLAMITGDRRSVASRVAEAIECAEFEAECLPQEKVEVVERIKGEGYRVGVVGDGVNDAPALAAGDSGIAMGAAGSDVAIHSATVALMSNDLQRVPFLVRLSRSARRTIYQNLAIGGLFIIVGLILSGLGQLNPIVAAILHNAGSLLVVFNSARLIRTGEELEQDTQRLFDQASTPAAERPV